LEDCTSIYGNGHSSASGFHKPVKYTLVHPNYQCCFHFTISHY